MLPDATFTCPGSYKPANYEPGDHLPGPGAGAEPA